MMEKPLAVFAIILFSVTAGIWSAEDTFFDEDEQHDNQVPLLPNWKDTSRSKAITHQYLTEKLLTAIKKENFNNLISGPELLEIRDMLMDDKYKPWGAASFPSSDNHNSHVILDKIDDELFVPNSERHSYDEQSHEEQRFQFHF